MKWKYLYLFCLHKCTYKNEVFPHSYGCGFLSGVLVTETEYKTHGYEYISHSPNISYKNVNMIFKPTKRISKQKIIMQIKMKYMVVDKMYMLRQTML